MTIYKVKIKYPNALEISHLKYGRYSTKLKYIFMKNRFGNTIHLEFLDIVHRAKGPAIEFISGHKSWYIDDRLVK